MKLIRVDILTHSCLQCPKHPFQYFLSNIIKTTAPLENNSNEKYWSEVNNLSSPLLQSLLTYALLGGYGYNLLFKQFYINATLSIGPGIQNREIRPDFVDKNTTLTAVSNIRVALGYNSDFFFAGLSTVNQFISTNLGQVDLNTGTNNLKIFLGFRFKERLIFKKKI